MKKIRVGVVGVGHLGQFHVEKYARMSGVQLVGAADIDPRRRQTISRRFGIPVYEDHRRLLSQIEAVSIAVPTSAHTAVTRDFLRQGIDVLVEKPITSSLSEAEELIALAEDRQCLLQVGHLERFNPVFQTAKDLITTPLFFECHRLAPFKSRGTDVDVVLDLMIHDLDLILHLIPEPVTEVRAAGVPVVSPLVDIAHVRLRFQNGSIANLTSSRISLTEQRRMRIFQPGAYLALDFLQKSYTRVRVAFPETGADQNRRLITETRSLAGGDALEEELKSFIRAVRTRCRPAVCAEDGRKALALALQIHQEIQNTLQSFGGSDRFSNLLTGSPFSPWKGDPNRKEIGH